MKRTFTKNILLLILCAVCLWSCGPVPEVATRYFDKAEIEHDDVRLTIFYPSTGSIKALIALREIGFIPIDKLTVIGVYHENEVTDYKKSIEYIKKNKIGWIQFHQLSAPLSKYTLFQKNACSDEFEAIFKKSDGIIFFGGADIPPYLYGRKTDLLTHIETPYRHFLELSCIFHLLGGLQDSRFKGFLESKPEFPVLGICLGCQSLNVGTGGTLIQDVWSEKYGLKFFEDVVELGSENWHTNPLDRLYPEQKLIPYNMHPIKLKEDGKFCAEMGFRSNDTPYILSAHHQMVDTPGKGIKVIATTLDGKVIEAVEHEHFPNVLGVQFHPEFPILWDTTEKFRFTPQDKEEKSLHTFLEENPLSFDFHKRIWAWFSQKLKEFKSKKTTLP